MKRISVSSYTPFAFNPSTITPTDRSRCSITAAYVAINRSILSCCFAFKLAHAGTFTSRGLRSHGSGNNADSNCAEYRRSRTRSQPCL